MEGETGKEPRSGVIGRSVENLVSVLLALLPGARGRGIHAGAADALVAVLVLLAVDLLTIAAAYGGVAPGYWDLRDTLGGTVLHFAALAVAAVLVGRARAVPGAVVGTAWALVLGMALALGLGAVFPVRGVVGWIWIYALTSTAPPVLYLLTLFGPLRGLAVSLALLASIAYPWADSYRLFDPPAGAARETAAIPDTEAVYGAQARLMAAQTGALRQGVPGQPELFAVLGAGDPRQGVFAREVTAVRGTLEDRFGAGGRVVSLVNSREAPTGYPLLDRTNLRAALKAVGGAMNPEDILLLFLTSHGQPGRIATEFWPVLSRDLTADQVAAALDASGIRNAVVIVSACYSGSFVGPLAAPGRLILTAARDDRTSFGCSDKAVWTDWSRAFFVEGLRGTRDFRAAARIALGVVDRSETERKLPHSKPQISQGEEIGGALDAWLATFD